MCDYPLPLAQQAMPTLDGMYWLMLTSRVLHVLGAVILLGGVFYLRAVVMPSPSATSAVNVDQKFGGLRSKWAMWVGVATLLLLATGFWNYFQYIRTYELVPKYHMILGIKMLGAFALFFLAALVAGRTAAAETIRQKMRFWLGICVAIGVLTVALGSVLRTFPHNAKVDAVDAPVLIAPSDAASADAPTASEN
jgi:uncharacterized membrane protein